MAGKSYEALNYRKTPRGQRGTYTYEFADGEKITVIPGAEGCTEIDIRRLHSIDDHEVYVNIKVSRPPVEEWEKRIREQWQREHPEEAMDKNWNLSMDIMTEDDGEEKEASSVFLKDALYQKSMEAATESPVERMTEVVNSLKPRLQAVYQLAMLDGIPNTRVAAMLGVSEGLIRKDIKTITRKLLEDTILKSFFRK